MDKTVTDAMSSALREYFDTGGKVGNVAEKLGITPNALRMKMRGESPWKLSEAVSIAELTGRTLDELAGANVQ